jgi:hypothetical protein
MRTIKKEVKVVTDWHGVLKEINKIGVFGAKKVKNISIKPYQSDLYDKPQYTLIIDTLEEHDD